MELESIQIYELSLIASASERQVFFFGSCLSVSYSFVARFKTPHISTLIQQLIKLFDLTFLIETSTV